MKEQELSSKVSQTIQEFEAMENIQPSEEWNNSLMQRLSVAKQNSTTGFSSKNFVVVMLFIVLLNIGFILKTMNDSQQTPNRSKELQLVSKELLFNPTSLNN